MPITDALLMSLWNFEEVPLCDDGIAVAMEFLKSAAQAVEEIETEEAPALKERFNQAFNVLVRHRARCEKCNEA